jgi:hypothetical protein
MAITINQEPATYSPAYNPLFFVATSDNTAEDNFNYIVDIYWSSTFQTRHRLPARPDNGRCLFDASEIVQNLITHDIDNSGTGYFFRNLNSFLKFQIKFGEEYDVAGVSTVFADLATSSNIYAFNASLHPDEFINWDPSYFLLANYSCKFLTNSPTIQKTRAGESMRLYSIASDPSKYHRLQVKKYNASGIISTDVIANPYTAASDSNMFLNAMVGYLDIEVALGAGYLTGATYYTVQVINSSGVAMSELRRFNIVTECSKYTPVRLHFLNKLGGFDSFTFTKSSKDSSNMDKSFYKSGTGSFSGSAFSISVSDREDQTLSVTVKDSITLNSDWLSEEESLWLKELVSSPIVFQDFAGQLKPVRILDTRYDPKKKVNEKLFNLSITLALKDSYRQRY